MNHRKFILNNLIIDIDILSVKLQDKKEWECVTSLEKIKQKLMEVINRESDDDNNSL